MNLGGRGGRLDPSGDKAERLVDVFWRYRVENIARTL
jgi:hypothetical protein